MNCTKCGSTMRETVRKYHYVECGLDNVFLEGCPVYTCQCGEEAPIIHHVEELHKIIGRDIVNRQSLLSGKEIKFLRKEMQLPRKIFAKLLCISSQILSKWEEGKENISALEDQRLRFIYKNHLEFESENSTMKRCLSADN